MPDDFELTTAELRTVARFATESAAEALPVFEAFAPDDPRPSKALDAARVFLEGAARSKVQRVTSLDAHRAAREVDDEAARYAARACGDAASAAYLHPLAQATQVGHILRATACTARALELSADNPSVGDRHVEQALMRATPELVDVLRRYPPGPTGRSRAAELMTRLDAALRGR